MKIVICGSTNVSMEEINMAADYFEILFRETNINVEIITPEINNMPIYKQQLQYVNDIRKADLVVIVPKRIYYEEDRSIIYIGDSTNYEMAIARSHIIPTIIWKGDM